MINLDKQFTIILQKFELWDGILPSNHVTVKLAAKARDEKRNANKIKNILGSITPLNILCIILLKFFIKIYFSHKNELISTNMYSK